MGIRDIVIPVLEVAVGETKFLVRGLSFADISSIVSKHAEAASTLFAKFLQSGEVPTIDEAGAPVEGFMAKLAGADFGSAGKVLLQTAPEVIVEIIVAGLDEDDLDHDDAITIVKRLPMPVQMETPSPS